MSTAEGTRTTARAVTSVGLVALGALVIGRVFDRPAALWLLLITLPFAALAATGRISVRLRRTLSLVTVGLAPVVGAAATGGRVPRDAVDGIRRGWSLAVSTDWPSPLRPELVAFFAFLIALASAAAVELARPRRWRAMNLVPALALAVLALVLSAPAGPPPAALLGAWIVLAAVVLALGDGGLPHAPLSQEVRGERRAVALVTALSVFGAVLVATAATEDRMDPRRSAENPLVQQQSLNPLAEVVAQRAVEPPQPVFGVDGELVDRWRTAVLDVYDGVTWRSEVTVRPVSADRLSPDGTTGSRQTITVESERLVTVPVPGVPLAVDRPVASDRDRSLLVPDESLRIGDRLVVDFEVSPRESDLAVTARSTRTPDDQAAALTALAEELAGPGSLTERLAALERSLRDGYQLSEGTAAGVNLGLLQSTLEFSRQGTAEQYVSSFALMARTLGARSRVAVGYRLPDEGATITTADALAWPEVWFEDVGWVAYDPVPTRVAQEGPARQQPVGAAPADIPSQPPTPPPAPDSELTEDDPSAADESGRGWVRAALAVAGGASGILLVVAALAGLVIVGKRRRRRRRLGSPFAHQRVLGAWAEATDRLVDLGARFRPHETNGEMAEAGSALLTPRGRVPLADLAGLANQAAHGPGRPDDLVAAHAVRLLGQIEQEADERLTRRRRWRASLSLRSLRPATRSPAG